MKRRREEDVTDDGSGVQTVDIVAKGDTEGPSDQKKAKSEEPAVTNPQSTTQPITDSTQQKPKRLPKKKVAVLVGYLGTGYSGLQR